MLSKEHLPLGDVSKMTAKVNPDAGELNAMNSDMSEPGREPEQATAASPAKASLLRRLLPVAILVVAMAVAYTTGLHRYLSLTALAENRAALGAFVSDNIAVAVAAFIAVYIVSVVLSLPGATILTIAGGLLFGWFWGGVIAVFAATLGATGVFLVARTAIGSSLSARAGPWLDKLSKGFHENAFSYLLFLRLAPIFPFWLVNLAPALLGVPLVTYVVATAVGIIPGTFTYSVVGAGLDSVIEKQREACAGVPDCQFDLSVSSLLTGEVIAAFALLALLALIPPIAKRFLGRGASQADGTN